MAIRLTLPFPPSANRYWRKTRAGRVILSEEAREFRQSVAALLAEAGSPTLGLARLAVVFRFFEPDRRRRDIHDNFVKQVTDALRHAGLYADDSQIDRHVNIRGPVQKPGCLEIVVAERRHA